MNATQPQPERPTYGADPTLQALNRLLEAADKSIQAGEAIRQAKADLARVLDTEGDPDE